MRLTHIQVICNGCGNEIETNSDPDSVEVSLTFTPPGEATIEGKFDLCPGCLSDWRDDITHVLTSQLVVLDEPEFSCSCGFSCATQRGLTRHQTARGHH